MRNLKIKSIRIPLSTFRKVNGLFLTSCFVSLLLLYNSTLLYAQQEMVSLATLDGVALTPDNIFQFQVQSTSATASQVRITGDLRYKASGLSWQYQFTYTLQPGMNHIDASMVHAQWSFSHPAFKELFIDYKTLPEGVYEYCVDVQPLSINGEPLVQEGSIECILGVAKDLFLINLVAPENDAKLYEYNPMLNWVVTYPFASLLTYRIRVAKILSGQNTENAIARNNPIYQEANVPQTAQVYPFYATPLVAFQPYAWTVDAYYKGILLGGAAPWKFTIIEDSVQKTLPHESYFVDIKNEQRATNYYAVGCIKLKYVLDDHLTEELKVSLLNKEGKQIQLPQAVLQMKLGDNRCVIELKDKVSLKHLGVYTLQIVDAMGQVYQLPFKYVNPDFL